MVGLCLLSSYHRLTASIPLEEDNFTTVSKWLGNYASNYLPAYDKGRMQRAPGTSMWFLDAAAYKKWVAMDHPLDTSPQNLECVGIRALTRSFGPKISTDTMLLSAGAGKTTIAYVGCSVYYLPGKQDIDSYGILQIHSHKNNRRSLLRLVSRPSDCSLRIQQTRYAIVSNDPSHHRQPSPSSAP